jgi:hypothetical protein
MMTVGDFLSEGYPPMPGFTMNNNIFQSGIWPVWSIGDQGGYTDCADSDVPTLIFSSCFANLQWGGNLIVGPVNTTYYPFPAGTNFAPTLAAVGFNPDYSLSATSPFKGTATDGSDPGVNVQMLDAATATAVSGVNH